MYPIRLDAPLQLPNLERLSLINWEYTLIFEIHRFPKDTFFHAPKLRNVALEGDSEPFSFDKLLPLNQIEEFDQRTKGHILHDFLALSPGVKRVVAQMPLYDMDLEELVFVKHSNLRRLEIDVNYVDFDGCIFRDSLMLPGLRELIQIECTRFPGFYRDRRDRENWPLEYSEFLIKIVKPLASYAELESLSLSIDSKWDLTGTTSELQRLLCLYLPALTYLQMSQTLSSGRSSPNIFTAFSSLTNSSGAENAPVPSLTTLSYTLSQRGEAQYADQSLFQLLNSLEDFLASRRAVSRMTVRLEKFTMRTKGIDVAKFAPFSYRLGQLRKDGMQLDLFNA